MTEQEYRRYQVREAVEHFRKFQKLLEQQKKLGRKWLKGELVDLNPDGFRLNLRAYGAALVKTADDMTRREQQDRKDGFIKTN